MLDKVISKYLIYKTWNYTTTQLLPCLSGSQATDFPATSHVWFFLFSLKRYLHKNVLSARNQLTVPLLLEAADIQHLFKTPFLSNCPLGFGMKRSQAGHRTRTLGKNKCKSDLFLQLEHVRPASQTNNSDSIFSCYRFIKGLLSFTKEIHYYILQLHLTGGMSLLRLIYGIFLCWTPFNDFLPSINMKENSSVRYFRAIFFFTV